MKCIFCHRDISDASIVPYCDDCYVNAPFNRGKKCKICDQPTNDDSDVCDFCKRQHKAFDRAVAPMEYVDPVRSVVLKFKNNNAKYLAQPIGRMMSDCVIDANFDFDVILPVPASPKALKRRGYNQSLLLAEQISKNLQKPCMDKAFAKILNTKYQKQLSFSKRQKNLQGAFKVLDKKAIFGKTILLVDDVITTCATINECAKELKKYARRVYVVGFARTYIKD